MTTTEAIAEIDAHLSSLSSAAHSKLSMPQVKERRLELHRLRAQAAALDDGDRRLDEIIEAVYLTDPIR